MGGQDIKFIEDNIIMGKKFCNKIWNASRFILMQKLIPIDAGKKIALNIKKLTGADKKILSQLREAIKSVNNDLGNFRFGKAAHKLYNFFWHDFCDKYIEQSKNQMESEGTQKILLYVLSNSLKLLHPFIPFVTEEIYQKLPLKNKRKFLMIEEWPR
jgi:valyl-tRNA synthetase